NAMDLRRIIHDNRMKIILKKAPDHPGALFLKAQLLHQAFGYQESVRKCLQRIIDMIPDDKEVHRWASDYLKQISLPENETKREDGRNEGDRDSS
ncbi:MAG: hypothetical protein L7F78_22660, partial [Syntrophales bacterium LBB04]|nr:hypothetical protein [Syntrophales bacterium LBB04]